MSWYRFGKCVLDATRRELTADHGRVKISARAFKTLQILLKRYPEAVSRDDLYAALWPDTFVNFTNLNNVIAEIRSAIGDSNKRILVTKHRFGYAIAVEVTTDEPAASVPSRFTLYIGGERIVLVEGDNLVGRSPDAVVLVDRPSISRRHAMIRVAGHRARVQDLQSKNGTFVDEVRVQDSYDLRDSAIIRFGSISGVFRAMPLDGTTVTDPAS